MTLLVLSSLIAAAVLLPFGGTAHRKTENGNRLYGEGAYADALRAYTEAQVDAPEAPELYYDIGNVLYREEDFEGAAEAFERALLSGSEALAGDAAFNLGNARFQLHDFEAAVDAYERSLRVVPDDAGAKRNLELALRALEQQQQQQQKEDSGEQGESGEPDQQEQQQPEPGDQGDQESESQPDRDSDDQSEDEPGANPSPAEAEEDGEQEQPQPGQMTEEQAERLLESLREQERENMRDQALQHIPALSRSAEQDW